MDKYAAAFDVDMVSRASSRISNLRGGNDDKPGRVSPKTIYRSSPLLPADDPADILVRGMFAAMGGMSVLFKGKDRVETLNLWSKVAVKGHKRDEKRHAYDDETDERLEYDLGEKAKEIDYKQHVLNAVQVFRTFMEDINEACQEGERSRRRVLELGGGDAVVASMRFVKDEHLLETCVDTVRLLNRESAARRYLLKARIDCTEALASVLNASHGPVVVEYGMDALSKLSEEQGVTSRFIRLGVLGSVIHLAKSSKASDVSVLNSCAHMAHSMAGDTVCAQTMTAHADDVARAMFRILMVCDHDDAVTNASAALDVLCEGPNRVTFGRHVGLVGLVTALERENRKRLLKMGAGAWLVSLVFTHDECIASAHHACTCVKSLEVDDEGKQQVLDIVRELIAPMNDAMSGRSSAASAIALPGSGRAGAAVHWTEQVMGQGRVRSRASSGVSQAASTRALMDRYLDDQTARSLGVALGSASLSKGGAWANEFPGTPPEPRTPADPATPAGSIASSSVHGAHPRAEGGSSALMPPSLVASHRRPGMPMAIMPDYATSYDPVGLPSVQLESRARTTSSSAAAASGGGGSTGLRSTRYAR